MGMTVTEKMIARADKLYIKDPRFSTKEDISAADGSGQTPLTFTGG